MTIVYSKLVASKCLQQFLFDKDSGEPLAAGRIDLYKDNNRLERKNWYYKTGSPGNYSFADLDNPLTLNGSGAIIDPSGNEINPWYYPFAEDSPGDTELYYIEVYNYDGTLQFTRQGFPPIEDSSDVNEISTVQNLIVNNRFWQPGSKQKIVGGNNIVSYNENSEVSITCTDQTNIVICPSKHEGFFEPDIRFKKSKTGANDIIEFKRLDLGQTNPDLLMKEDVNPEFYISASCTAATTGETFKYIQIPIALNIRNLEGENAICTVQMRKGQGSSFSPVSISILKYLGYRGTSGSEPGQGEQIKSDITLKEAWTKEKAGFTFAAFETGDTPAPLNDDGYYLQINLPANETYEIAIALPSIFLGDTAPTNDFDSYDKAGSVIYSPRTGDIRHSMNGFYPNGWLPAINTSLGSVSSGATYNSTFSWPLYRLLYTMVAEQYAPVIGGKSGETDADAYLDYTANKPLFLTANLGRVLAGANPQFDRRLEYTVTITPENSTSVDTGANTATFATLNDLGTGDVVEVSAAKYGLVPNFTYYIRVISGTTIGFYDSLEHATSDSFRLDLTTDTGSITLVNTTTKINLTGPSDNILETGTPVVFTTSAGGANPNGLNPGVVYFIDNPSPSSLSSFKIANSLENAINSYNLNFKTTGSGTLYMSQGLGALNGNSAHTLTVPQLPAHQHEFTVTPPDPFLTNPPSGGNDTGSGADTRFKLVNSISGATRVAGSNQEFNIMQSTTYVNVFIKL